MRIRQTKTCTRVLAAACSHGSPATPEPATKARIYNSNPIRPGGCRAAALDRTNPPQTCKTKPMPESEPQGHLGKDQHERRCPAHAASARHSHRAAIGRNTKQTQFRCASAPVRPLHSTKRTHRTCKTKPMPESEPQGHLGKDQHECRCPAHAASARHSRRAAIDKTAKQTQFRGKSMATNAFFPNPVASGRTEQKTDSR